MKSIFEAYAQLWAPELHASIKPILSQVPVMNYPEDRLALSKVVPSYVVIVMQAGASISDVINLAEMGFEHVIRSDRDDFPQELLASGLMAMRPEAFVKNPLPFFFNGFRSPNTDDPDKNLTLKITNSAEKGTVLDWLNVFLQQNPRTSGVRDLVLQSADEMITNALYNAPLRPSGVRPYQSWPRSQPVTLPANQAATLFSSFNDQRVIVGCSDVFGSLSREIMLAHLRQMFKDTTVRPREGLAGAGIGFRYLIDNAANFYLLEQPGKQTLIAAGFLLKGLKANLAVSKHFHFSFRENV